MPTQDPMTLVAQALSGETFGGTLFQFGTGAKNIFLGRAVEAGTTSTGVRHSPLPLLTVFCAFSDEPRLSYNTRESQWGAQVEVRCRGRREDSEGVREILRDVISHLHLLPVSGLMKLSAASSEPFHEDDDDAERSLMVAPFRATYYS